MSHHKAEGLTLVGGRDIHTGFWWGTIPSCFVSSQGEPGLLGPPGQMGPPGPLVRDFLFPEVLALRTTLGTQWLSSDYGR